MDKMSYRTRLLEISMTIGMFGCAPQNTGSSRGAVFVRPWDTDHDGR